MPLVDYPDSDDSSQPPPKLSTNTNGTKRKRSSPPPIPKTTPNLPPLPSTFHDLYATSTRLSKSDDPSLHGGRQRQTPHVEGNWPTHVYIEFHPPPETYTRLQSLIANLDIDPAAQIQTLLHSPLSTPLPLHISLSHPLTLHSSQRSSFQQNLTSQINALNIPPFTLHFPLHPNWHPNADHTRHFLVLRPGPTTPSSSSQAQTHILTILKAANAAAASAGQPALYASDTAPPSPHPGRKSQPGDVIPGSKAGLMRLEGQGEDKGLWQGVHVSIGWALAAPPLAVGVSPVPREARDDEEVDAAGVEVRVDSVKIKMGNVIHVVPLRGGLGLGGSGARGEGWLGS